jgi:formylglycine-generating enzyme required for sulfatase activity
MKTKKKQRPVFSLINEIYPKFPETKVSDSSPAQAPLAPIKVSSGQPAPDSTMPPSSPPKPARPTELPERPLQKEPAKRRRTDRVQKMWAPENPQELHSVRPGRVEEAPARQPVQETIIPRPEPPAPEIPDSASPLTPPPLSHPADNLKSETSSLVQVRPLGVEERPARKPVEETIIPRPESPAPEIPNSASPLTSPPLSRPVDNVETSSPVQALVPPTLRLAAVDHNFGRLLVGQSETWELSVYNDGDDDLLITGLDGLPTSGFKLIAPPLLPFTIMPRGKLNLTIQFAPGSGGVQQARLRLCSEAIKASFPEITLSGTAIRVISTDAGLHYSPIFHSLGLVFIYIEAGTFVMGSPETEPGRRSDELQHEVIITKPYYIQSTPVTQKQWQAIMGDTPSKFSPDGDERPVEGVTWNRCQEFIKRLNSRGEGLYRLPSEAEWEYACRAHSLTAFPNGDIINLFCDGDPNLDALGWYCYNADNQTHPVGLKEPNSWGLYDMHGNISEWCQDWYGEYAQTRETDPQGPLSGLEKVVRGGSWFASAKNCRSASRFKWPPNSRTNLHVIGFRLVREV